MEMKVNIISRELIKPSSSTPLEKKKHKLSVLDQILPHAFIRLLFFYETQKPSDSEKATIIIDDPSKKTLQLKQSLSECLTKFYPLAGKLSSDNLSVDCDDSGVLFVEAKFECGSKIVAVSFSHKICDLLSMITLMNSWANLNRGENTVVKPNFHVGTNLFPPLDDHDFSFRIVGAKGKVLRKRFVFNKEKITELKQLAISSSKDASRVEVINAFIWKNLISVERAKQQHHPGVTTTVTSKIQHAVNLRNRVIRNRANEFPFGNMAVPAVSKFTLPDDDEDQDNRDFYGDLVRHTSDAIRGVNGVDYVFTRVIPILQNVMKRKPPTISVAETRRFSSWCRFPIYEVDFGWGKPFLVGPASDTSVSGVILKDTRDGEGIEAWINILEDEFILLPDEFLSLASTCLF
ncbi:OLC1v1036733C1 [Oldenlandia corymbosa var. corymbosa]|uniref:OLC1v1036733C1 n=1 Tax=Oldenlandia corymbosa var. corymbosa TaxID=529605 RepID=A0AAV1CW00_OLDCO|nr:OLC1v1036733C1 [Oldenlandia corymbosa var. corymbosa]